MSDQNHALTEQDFWEWARQPYGGPRVHPGVERYERSQNAVGAAQAYYLQDNHHHDHHSHQEPHQDVHPHDRRDERH
ncbi:hypothetical protein OESDEN_19177 [Oesophagostomum dentatum]|uniref:Uncharacterized protein n=1 Tax=Oesophagostomum dentatum TaxID=61180 RepID=A0A0B1SCB4_OESDE|nr:hypothetical protein OESDEN_19177 [Oesophagostomum dentatum]